MLSVWGRWHPWAAGVMAVPLIMSLAVTVTVSMSTAVTNADSSRR